MRQPIVAMMLALGAVSACSSSHPALPPCDLDADSTGDVIGSCSGQLVCAPYSVPTTDGTCHGVSRMCVLPCQKDSDCVSLGPGAVCSSACGSPVCTPFQ
jgi:hypothetical protein